MPSTSSDFDALIAEAMQQPFSGWDFAFVAGRMRESALPWDYAASVRAAFVGARDALDLGTGGGEFLASLQPLPPRTCAAEAYAPNVPVARARLEPLGVRVTALASDDRLPFESGGFDLVIDRHEKFIAEEVARVLRRGGRFITQQVGERNLRELNEWLHAAAPERPSSFQRALAFLRNAGLEVVDSRETQMDTAFTDIGAIVYYLRAVPWQVRDFTVERYRERLRAMHAHIQAAGSLLARGHRYLIDARKP